MPLNRHLYTPCQTGRGIKQSPPKPPQLNNFFSQGLVRRSSNISWETWAKTSRTWRQTNQRHTINNSPALAFDDNATIPRYVGLKVAWGVSSSSKSSEPVLARSYRLSLGRVMTVYPHLSKGGLWILDLISTSLIAKRGFIHTRLAPNSDVIYAGSQLIFSGRIQDCWSTNQLSRGTNQDPSHRGCVWTYLLLKHTWIISLLIPESPLRLKHWHDLPNQN